MFAKSVAVVALFFAVAASALNVDTPTEIKECQNLDITYGQGAPKYLLAVVPGSDPCADALKEFDETSDTKQTWQVNVVAGTKVMFVVEDSTGAEAWSGSVTVKEGDKSCLPKVESAPSSSTTPASTTKPATTPSTTPPKSTGAPKVVSPGGVANVEAGAPAADSAAASSFVISSAAVACVIGAAALLL
jgi:hypothetical protein